jgi:hypothetical protein
LKALFSLMRRIFITSNLMMLPAKSMRTTTSSQFIKWMLDSYTL